MICKHPLDRLMNSADYPGKMFCIDCERIFTLVEFLPKEEKPEEDPWETLHKLVKEPCPDCLDSLKNGHICGSITKPSETEAPEENAKEACCDVVWSKCNKCLTKSLNAMYKAVETFMEPPSSPKECNCRPCHQHGDIVDPPFGIAPCKCVCHEESEDKYSFDSEDYDSGCECDRCKSPLVTLETAYQRQLEEFKKKDREWKKDLVNVLRYTTQHSARIAKFEDLLKQLAEDENKE